RTKALSIWSLLRPTPAGAYCSPSCWICRDRATAISCGNASGITLQPFSVRSRAMRENSGSSPSKRPRSKAIAVFILDISGTGQALLRSVALLPAKRARLAWPQRRTILFHPALFASCLCGSGFCGILSFRLRLDRGCGLLLHLNGFLDANAAAVHLHAVKRTNRRLGLSRHGHIGETEALGASGQRVHDNSAGLHPAVVLEQGQQCVRRGVPGQVAKNDLQDGIPG